MQTPLRASIVIDYQNVHLGGHDLFESTRRLPRHETLIDPLVFSQRLLRARNAAQRAGMAHAVLNRVLVYRGQPSSLHDSVGYARNQAQKAQWERDRRVNVTLRPLKYPYRRDEFGQHVTDHVGNKIISGPPRRRA